MQGAVLPLIAAVLIFSTCLVPCWSFYRCDGTPEYYMAPRASSNNRFTIKIAGNPHSYVPGWRYTVSVQSTRQLPVPEKFIGFALTVESSRASPGSLAKEGTFHLYGDALSKYSEKCPHMVMQASKALRSEVNVYWIAPTAGGGCVTFRSEVNVYTGQLTVRSNFTIAPTLQMARDLTVNVKNQEIWSGIAALANPKSNGPVECGTTVNVEICGTVIEQRDLWFMHDGLLTKTICEDIQENIDEPSEVMEKCCACDEAKYEVTFEGLWSRHSHPKDFPADGWMTRFSDVIGASHNSDYRIWTYGGTASDGLAEMVEFGDTKELEAEIKNQSSNIRTIIKAKGISYPNVTGKTFAVFRVDNKHHLMSLLSMIVPSPDWIVGVSGLELCLHNCSWANYKVANMKPWDAGTDSGTTYLSPDTPTVPREPIQRISSKYPDDESNPFYDPSGEEMKPIARLHITRQKLYPKSCAEESASQEATDECAVSEWSEWSSCTATCGRASMTRSRSYISEEAEEQCVDRPDAPELQETARCQLPDCEGEIHSDHDENCPEPNWSEWSDCSVTCGTGVKTRTTIWSGGRRDPNCPYEQRSEQVECYQSKCTTEDEESGMCLLPWDAGSCNGRKERFYFDKDSASCVGFIYRGCKGNENNFVTQEECESACAAHIDPAHPRKPKDNFNGIAPGSQVIESEPESSPTDNTADNQECEVSKWSRWSACSVSCGRGFKTKTRRIVSYAKYGVKCNKKLERTKPCGKRDCGTDNDQQVPNASGESVGEEEPTATDDCSTIMGKWTPWSPCSATCGVQSSQMRTRWILAPPSGNGPLCSRVETRSCNLLPCKA